MTSPNRIPNRSWTKMVAASRKEKPSPVDVRYLVRAELESQLKSGSIQEDQETDWISALVNLFHPGFVKLGVAAAFACMLVLSGTSYADNEDLEAEYSDPLANAFSAMLSGLTGYEFES